MSAAKKLLTTVTAIVVRRENDSTLSGESAIEIRLQDDGAGYFFEIKQLSQAVDSVMRIDVDELEALASAGRALIAGAEGES